MDDELAHTAQELLIVRNHQQRLLPALEVVVKPDDCVEIEMIRRLIQKKQIRLHEQSAGQADTHSPASGEGGRGLLLHLRRESQTGQDAAHAGLRFVHSEDTHLAEHFVVLRHLRITETTKLHDGLLVFIVIVFLAIQNCLQLFLSLQQLGALCICLQHRLHGRGVISFSFLLHVQNVQIRWNGQFAAGNHLQQGGFSLAIGTQQTVAATVNNLTIILYSKEHLQIGILEQGLSLRIYTEPFHIDVLAVNPGRVILIPGSLSAGELVRRSASPVLVFHVYIGIHSICEGWNEIVVVVGMDETPTSRLGPLRCAFYQVQCRIEKTNEGIDAKASSSILPGVLPTNCVWFM